MIPSPLVVLDACVLANFSLCDTLLRLAEPPALFTPKWSQEIIRETVRTLESKLGWPHRLTTHFENELRAHFSGAWVHNYEVLLPEMMNDNKDRHVLAAAACCNAPVLLTFNLRHFRREHLDHLGIQALHPQTFLTELFRHDEQIVLSKLKQQSADRGRDLEQLLAVLNKSVPEFATAVSSVIGLT